MSQTWFIFSSTTSMEALPCFLPYLVNTQVPGNGNQITSSCSTFSLFVQTQSPCLIIEIYSRPSVQYNYMRRYNSLMIFIDCTAGKIIRLVASVCLSVRLFLCQRSHGWRSSEKQVSYTLKNTIKCQGAFRAFKMVFVSTGCAITVDRAFNSCYRRQIDG